MGMWNGWFGKRGRDEPAGHGVEWADPRDAPTAAAIYQVCYSEATRTSRDPAFLPMDNSANQRPDWREYHPIRSFLLAAPLDDQRFYGFLSPKFRHKTLLEGRQVHAFIDQHLGADVVLFSPFLDLQALFLNSFVQGEYFHPGLLARAEGFLGQAGFDIELASLVMDHGRSVFSNYFVAKPPFWRAWLALAEQLHQAAETPGPMHKLLTARAPYVDEQNVEFKVFILERIADLLLATDASWSVASYPDSRLSDLPVFPDDAALVVEADALKAAYRISGDASYLDRYRALLDRHSLPPSRQDLWLEYQRRLEARQPPP